MSALPTISSLPQRSGLGNTDPNALPAPAPSPLAASDAKLKREEEYGFIDYAKASFRQDSLIPGIVNRYVGSQFLPDASFNPFEDKEVQEMQGQLWEEHKGYLLQGNSRAHTQFLYQQLKQKQSDLEHLGDMGVAGNVARVIGGFAMPDQIALGLATGGLGTLYRAGRVGAAGFRAGTAVERVTLRAEEAARQAASASGAMGYASTIARGALENAVVTRELNKYNFNDENEGLIQAAITGATLSGAFHPLGASASRRLSDLTHKDAAVLRATLDASEGRPITVEQAKLVQDMHRVSSLVDDFHNGKISAEEVDAKLEKLTAPPELFGPHEPDSRWLDRFQETVRKQAQDIIDQNFSSPVERSRGMSDASKAQLVARGEKEAAAAREQIPAAEPDLPTLWSLHDGSKVTLEGQMKRKLEKAFALRAMDSEKARRAKDLEALTSGASKAKVDAMDAAWAAHEANQAKTRASEEEMAWNQRDLQDMGQEPQPGVRTAQPDPTYAPPAPPEAPSIPGSDPSHWQGREVSWINKQGDVVYGTVDGVNQYGRLEVTDTHGKTHSVAPEKLDQFQGHEQAPDGFIHAGNLGAAQHLEIANELTPMSALTSVKVKGKEVDIRWDYSKVFNTSALESVRKLGFALVKDPTGFEGHATQRRTVSELATEVRRVHAGAFHFQFREALAEAMKAAQVPMHKTLSFRNEFASLVTRHTRGDASVARDYPQLMPAVQKASSQMQKFYKTVLDLAREKEVKGAEFIPDDTTYVTRMWDHQAIRRAAEKFGWEKIHEAIGHSIKDKQRVIDKARKDPKNAGKTDSQLLNEKGARFLKSLISKQYDVASRDLMMAGGDEAAVRESLKQRGYKEGEVDDVIDVLFEAKMDGAEQDAGRAAQLKFRFNLDENFSLSTDAGELRLSDLLENDARALVDSYATGMGGHIAFADHGILSEADWQRSLKEVQDEASSRPELDGIQVEKELQHLQDVRSKIMGRPMSQEVFNTTSRMLGAFQAMTRGASLAQLGATSAFELVKSVATFGVRNLIHNLPSLGQFLTAVRQGYVPDKGMARDIMEWTGMGYETASTYFKAKQAGDGALDKFLTGFENVGGAFSHGINALSGNDSITSLTKHISAMSAASQFSRYARGIDKVPAGLQNRWAGAGLDLDRQAMFMEQFKRYSEVDSNGRLVRIDHETWTAENPYTASEFKNFLTRQARDAIQDHDIGETMPVQHTPLGKLFGELKTFFLVGHAKNTLKQLHYMDATSARILMFGMVGEILAYSTQQAINAPDKLNERLTPEKIGLAVFNRAAVLGMIPTAIETGYNVISGGDSLLSPGTTANTDNRSMLITPSMQFAKKLGNAGITFGGLVMDSDTATQKELRDLRDTIPLARYYGLRYLTEQFILEAPKSDPEHPWAR